MLALSVCSDINFNSPFEHVIADMLPRSVSVPNWAVVIPHRRKVAKGVEVRMLVVLWKKVDVEDV